MLTPEDRRAVLETVAKQAEVFAAECARLATLAPGENAEQEQETADELNVLVGFVEFAHNAGALPEKLHSAHAIYLARRTLEKLTGPENVT